MPRRAPHSEYHEEDKYDDDDDTSYSRNSRLERTYVDEMDIPGRRRRFTPPVEDFSRMRIRDQPPREFVRETVILPTRHPGPPGALGRAAEDCFPYEDDYYRDYVWTERRSHRARDWEADDEGSAGERTRRSLRRPRAAPGLYAEEEMSTRRGREVPPLVYESDVERRPRERRYSDIQDEVIVRSSNPRRKPHRRDEVDEMEGLRRSRHRGDPPDPVLLTREEEQQVHSKVMKWQDQPSPREAREMEEEQEIMARDMRHGNRRSVSRTRYERGPPGAWPEDPIDDMGTRPLSRQHSGTGREEIEIREEFDTRRESFGRGRPRKSIEIEEIIIHKGRRRGSLHELHERVSSRESGRLRPILKEIITITPNVDRGYDSARSPRVTGSGRASARASYDEIDTYHESRGGGRRSDENISWRRQEKDSISPTTFRSTEFRDPWKTDERRSRKLQSLASENDPQAAESVRTRSRRSQRQEYAEDEMELRGGRSVPRSAVSDIKKERIDDWSVIHVPRKEDPVEMTGGLDFVERTSKVGSAKASEAAEVEIDERSRASPEPQQKPRRERWTEVAKSLIVRDAIERCGYEFEETTHHYYIFSFLEAPDIDQLVELSDEIRVARRQRIREMHRERASIAPRSSSVVDQRVPRVPWSGERRIREREWVGY